MFNVAPLQMLGCTLNQMIVACAIVGTWPETIGLAEDERPQCKRIRQGRSRPPQCGFSISPFCSHLQGQEPSSAVWILHFTLL